MQQTDKYKLNKPGADDPIAIAPLNENMDKVEGALDGLAAQAADLTQRMVTLENCRIVVGWYRGNSDNNGIVIDLGERPLAVLVSYSDIYWGYSALTTGDHICIYKDLDVLWLEDNGFHVNYSLNSNYEGGYSYIAFLGGWPEINFPDPPPKP